MDWFLYDRDLRHERVNWFLILLKNPRPTLTCNTASNFYHKKKMNKFLSKPYKELKTAFKCYINVNQLTIKTRK